MPHDELAVRDEYGELVGRIKHNESLSNLFCVCAWHPACVRTRTYRASNRQGSGAPLGFLAGWALEDVPDKLTHMQCFPEFEQRQEARERLKAEYNAEPFFQLEEYIPEAEDGPEEPPIVPRR